MNAVLSAPKSPSKAERAAGFDRLIAEAFAAGRKAGVEARPHPMIVAHEAANGGIDYSKPVYFVDDGACGFAWVKIRPANSPFAKHLLKAGIARGSWNGGVDIWIGDFGQSIDRKEKMAVAMAKVFKDAGIQAYAESRLD